MFFNKVLACRCYAFFKPEYYSSTVQKSLAVKNLNADSQLQAHFAASNSYNTKAYYLPQPDYSAAQPRSSFQNSIPVK